MNDGRDKVRVDDDTSRRVVFVCTMSGRRAADVRAEALRIGAEFLESKYKEPGDMNEAVTQIPNETVSRQPNRKERRAKDSILRTATPAKTRGTKVTKRKVST